MTRSDDQGWCWASYGPEQGESWPVLHVTRPRCALSDLVLDENGNWQVQPRCQQEASHEVAVAEGVTATCPRHAAWMRETCDVIAVRRMVTL